MAKTTVVAPPVERVISLELTEKEAALLYYLTAWKVVGPNDGPRGHSDAIFEALAGLDLNISAIQAATEPSTKIIFTSYAEGNK